MQTITSGNTNPMLPVALPQGLIKGEEGQTLKASLQQYYFSKDQANGHKVHSEFTNVKEDIYLPPSTQTPSREIGLDKEEEDYLRAYGAALIKKVGIALDIPNETILFAQNIYQRFYYG